MCYPLSKVLLINSETEDDDVFGGYNNKQVTRQMNIELYERGLKLGQKQCFTLLMITIVTIMMTTTASLTVMVLDKMIMIMLMMMTMMTMMMKKVAEADEL